MLANGEQDRCRIYRAAIYWHDERRQVEVYELGSHPLIGMALLNSNRVALDVREDGPVTIEPL